MLADLERDQAPGPDPIPPAAAGPGAYAGFVDARVAPADARRRAAAWGLALAAAVGLHALVGIVIEGSSLRPAFLPRPRQAVTVALVTPPPPPPSPPPPPPPTTTTATPSTPAAPAASARTPTTAPPAPTATTTPAPAPATTTTPPVATTPTTPPPAAPSLLRLPSTTGTLDGVLGVGSGAGVQPSRAALEGALDLRVDGPARDSVRAAREATRDLQADLADDAVSAGLADDYFRTLRREIEIAWQPEVQQLNDGGASTTQAGMLRGFVEERGAWGELWAAYLDLAKQYGNGLPQTLEPARRQRLRELMRSRKGAFRVHAIAEMKLTQDPSGRVLLLELPLPSGHPRIDDGLRQAIERAIAAMPAAPPDRLSHGRSFSSWWRLRATWTMVPPTALLTGAGFDITAKGFTVDVPFDVKRTTHVLLQRTDAKTTAGADGG